ncbi:MAG: sulfurtransferase-like selenium metabolism protein YedF [Bacteroidia bacterium]|nr:sulfurtransferase-like selenium metabolism protein YedF [Bacteroidia bacterium]
METGNTNKFHSVASESEQLQTFETQDYVICFKNDKMGFCPDDLGTLLIKGCISTIGKCKPLPKIIIFYGNGVNLTVKGSPVVEQLKELEAAGIKLLICGTCANYFNITEKIGAGTISNMYEIMQTLTDVQKIIYP